MADRSALRRDAATALIVARAGIRYGRIRISIYDDVVFLRVAVQEKPGNYYPVRPGGNLRGDPDVHRAAVQLAAHFMMESCDITIDVVDAGAVNILAEPSVSDGDAGWIEEQLRDWRRRHNRLQP